MCAWNIVSVVCVSYYPYRKMYVITYKVIHASVSIHIHNSINMCMYTLFSSLNISWKYFYISTYGYTPFFTEVVYYSTDECTYTIVKKYLPGTYVMAGLV